MSERNITKTLFVKHMERNDAYANPVYSGRNHRYSVLGNWVFNCMGNMVYYVYPIAYGQTEKRKLVVE